MPGRNVPVCVVVLTAVPAGIALVPGRLGPAAASQASPAADCPATTPEENEALFRRYVEEAYNGRNPDVIADLFADDFVRHNAAAPQLDQQPGFTDDIARLQTWLAAFPDLEVTIEELISSGDTVAVYATWHGTQDGPLPPWDAPATGRPMARESLAIWRVACGQLAEVSIVADNLTMLRQLGIVSDEELTSVGTPTVATPAP
jgi:predicted ester cyclase